MAKTVVSPATEELKGHPGLSDIFILLCSGWPSTRVANVVSKRHGILTTADAVEEYLDTIPDECLFNATALARPSFHESVIEELSGAVRASEMIVDTRGEATQCLLLMRSRIEAMALAEASSRPSKLLTDAIKVYFAMLGLYEDRYILKTQGYGASDDIAAEPAITLREILDEQQVVPRTSQRSLLPGADGDARPVEQANRFQLPTGTS